MQTWQGLPASQRSRISRGAHRATAFSLALVFAFAMLGGGCGSPAEPIERKPPVPEAVSDLAATQSGNSVILTFDLPKEAVDRRPLDNPLTVEIYRDFEAAGATAPTNSAAKPSAPANPTLHATIPAAVIANYSDQDRVRYTDPLQPEDFTQHPDSIAVYEVRTRASAKKESADSNVVALSLHPAPEPIGDVRAEVTHSGIEVSWTPPQKTPVGPAPPIAVYRVYRSELQPPGTPGSPAAAPARAAEKESAKLPLAALRIGETETTTYLDTQFQLGETYIYTVRSVVQYGPEQIESADSDPFTLLARDVTPPATPEGLLVVDVPAQDNVPAHIELSWGISSETDLAGYNLYRSEQAGVAGARANADLLRTPAFRDMNAMPGRAYFYSVTAVDRSGNESPPSADVEGAVPAESKPTP